METQEIRLRAKQLGIESNKMKKTELIRKIQSAEGNTPCFKVSPCSCNEKSCCWREDCL